MPSYQCTQYCMLVRASVPAPQVTQLCGRYRLLSQGHQFAVESLVFMCSEVASAGVKVARCFHALEACTVLPVIDSLTAVAWRMLFHEQIGTTASRQSKCDCMTFSAARCPRPCLFCLSVQQHAGHALGRNVAARFDAAPSRTTLRVNEVTLDTGLVDYYMLLQARSRGALRQ